MRVLIAEDDSASRAILQAALAELGHELTAASNGAEAWELFRAGEFEVVVSDRLMPGLDGIEFCRRIRADTARPYVYFIFLTSAKEKGRFAEGMKIGADDYLLKPLDRDELAARLIVARRITDLYRTLDARQRQMEILNRRLHEQARSDPLTGLGTRLKLREDLDLIVGTENRGISYGAIMCDVDCFKPYNDSYGHLAGDDVLANVASTIRKQMRDGTAGYRYGGEEFLLIEPIASPQAARSSAERHRAAIEALAIPHRVSPLQMVTISCGVACFRPGGDMSVNDWLKAADGALYRAKELGRNQVVAESVSLEI